MMNLCASQRVVARLESLIISYFYDLYSGLADGKKRCYRCYFSVIKYVAVLA